MPALQPYEKGLDYSYAAGFFPSMEALKKQPSLVRRVLLSSGAEESAAGKEIQALCEKLRIRTETADKALRRILGKDNTFAAAVFEKRQSDLSAAGRQLLLHQPQDRGNLGTMLRTALGFGFLDVAIIGPAADPFDPHVVRASMGAIFSLRIRLFDRFEDYADTAKERQLYPFMLTASKPLEEGTASIRRPYALVFGSEGGGLPDSFAGIGQPLRIPHSGEIDSLNLAVAAAIGMYAFARKDGG